MKTMIASDDDENIINRWMQESLDSYRAVLGQTLRAALQRPIFALKNAQRLVR